MQSNAPPVGEGVQGGVAYGQRLPTPSLTPAPVPGGAASSTGPAQRRPRWRMGLGHRARLGTRQPTSRRDAPHPAGLLTSRRGKRGLRSLPAAGHHLSLLHVSLSRRGDCSDGGMHAGDVPECHVSTSTEQKAATRRNQLLRASPVVAPYTSVVVILPRAPTDLRFLPCRVAVEN